MSEIKEQIVERLRPSAVVDHVPGIAVSALRACGEPTLADRLNSWIVRNNGLKTEAIDTIEAQAKIIDQLRLEAQGHASEAQTANSTIYEIYQVISGATGEPGNWNGASPVREYAEAAQARIEDLDEALRECFVALETAEDHCNRDRFRASSPRLESEVRHLRTSAIRRARLALNATPQDGKGGEEW